MIAPSRFRYSQMQPEPAIPDEYPRESEPVLECPPCPLCGSPAAKSILQARDSWVSDGVTRAQEFSVVRCEVCRACYTTPRFPEATKRLAYIGSYPFYQRARQVLGPPTEAEILAFDRRARQVARLCPRPGRILDIGMGDGAFLELMRRRGWETAGVDAEPDVVAYARERLGLEACTVADVECDRLPEGPFDVVTMWGLLQLTYHPQRLLENVRAALSPDGVIAIGVSNIGSLGARLFGSRWRGLGLPRHLVHFDQDSLCRLVERSGFRPLALAFETPFWIVAPSFDAVFPLPGLLGGAARRCAWALLSLGGRTRLGDTMTLLGQVWR
jgi:SAM-dependent methyltransferase